MREFKVIAIEKFSFDRGTFAPDDIHQVDVSSHPIAAPEFEVSKDC